MDPVGAAIWSKRFRRTAVLKSEIAAAVNVPPPALFRWSWLAFTNEAMVGVVRVGLFANTKPPDPVASLIKAANPALVVMLERLPVPFSTAKIPDAKVDKANSALRDALGTLTMYSAVVGAPPPPPPLPLLI